MASGERLFYRHIPLNFSTRRLKSAQVTDSHMNYLIDARVGPLPGGRGNVPLPPSSSGFPKIGHPPSPSPFWKKNSHAAMDAILVVV